VTAVCICQVKIGKNADGYGTTIDTTPERIPVEGGMMNEPVKSHKKPALSAVAFLTRVLSVFPLSRQPVLPAIYTKYLANSYQTKKETDSEFGVNCPVAKPASPHPERRPERFNKAGLERPHAHATLNLARDDLEAITAFA
jgi:hypothetical protein